MQRKWLNAYHQRCVEETGQYILNLEGDHQQAYDWLVARTGPVPDDPNWEDVDHHVDGATAASANQILAICVAMATLLFK